MKLQETLQHFDAALRFKFSPPSVPKISKAAREIERAIGSGEAAQLRAPREILDECRNAIVMGELDKVSTKNLRLFCTAGLSSLEELNDPISSFNLLLAEVTKRAKASLIKALFLGYLLVADQDAKWVSKLRHFIFERRESLAPRWWARINDYGLLQTDPGSYFAGKFFNDGDQFFNELTSAGITGILLTTGIGKCIFKAVTHAVGQSDWVHGADAQLIFERLKKYALQDEKLVFAGSDNQRSMCHAILEPCTKGDPDEDLLTQVKNLLIGQYSDPRVNPGRWGSVDERHVQVLQRWLTRQSMGLLIEVLNRTADDNHWDVRNDFWSYYLDNDLVNEAWVVFGPEASQHAMDLVNNNPDFSASSFGRFRSGGGSGVQPNHSVLLMRIDDVVVAEWTHNGRVRLWDRRSPRRPNFYQATYYADQLRGARNRYTADEEHSHDRGGNWMLKVDRFIVNYTGIKHPLNVKSGTERDARIKRKSKASNPRAYAKASGSAAGQKLNEPKPQIRTIRPPSEFGKGLARGNAGERKRCLKCRQMKTGDQYFKSTKRPGELTKYCDSCLSAKEERNL